MPVNLPSSVGSPGGMLPRWDIPPPPPPPPHRRRHHRRHGSKDIPSPPPSLPRCRYALRGYAARRYDVRCHNPRTSKVVVADAPGKKKKDRTGKKEMMSNRIFRQIHIFFLFLLSFTFSCSRARDSIPKSAVRIDYAVAIH